MSSSESLLGSRAVHPLRIRQIAVFLWGLFVVAVNTSPTLAANITFGSGINEFSIEFVRIGCPGNAQDGADTPGDADDDFGAVTYIYQIAKYEVSRDMIDKANANDPSLGLLLQDMSGLGGNGANRPATGLSWYAAARFVNWLNTSSGGVAAYKFDVMGNFQLWESGDIGYDPANPYRNSLASFWLPSANEWYKAAYYDQNSGTYFDYPTGSNTLPDGIDVSGDAAFEAVFNDGFDQGGPNDVTNAGVASPFGTVGQGGNVWEWEETAFDVVNDGAMENRTTRGGWWAGGQSFLQGSTRGVSFPSNTGVTIGFRVASVVPEPSGIILVLIGVSSMLSRRRGF